MAVYITGDTHGDYDIAKIDLWEDKVGPTAADTLIICGDWGAIWGRYDGGVDNSMVEYWAKKPYTVAFCDGNHENHEALEALPTRSWCGGEVGDVAPNIVHLRRGQVYTLENSTYWVMGGGESIDKAYRTMGVSWWPREMPTYTECKKAWEALKAQNFEVDYIVSHDCPYSLYEEMYGEWGEKTKNSLNAFLDEVAECAKFKRWYFGHHHRDFDANLHYTALYQMVVPIGGGTGKEVRPFRVQR